MSSTKTPPPYSFTPPSQESSAVDDRLDTRFYSYFQIIWKRKFILAACVLFTVLVAVFVNFTQRPYYRTSIEVVLEPKNIETQGSSSASLIQDPTFFLTQIRMIQGPLLAERAVKKLESSENRKPLLSNFGVKAAGKPAASSVFSDREKAALAGAIRGTISADQVERGARILRISTGGYVPVMVKQVCDAVAQSYIELNYESRILSFKQSFSIISKSLSEGREKIKIGEMAAQKVDSEIQLFNALKIYGEKHPQVITLRFLISSLEKQFNEGNRNAQIADLTQRRDLLPLILEAHLDLEGLTAIEADLRILKPILEQEIATHKEMYNSIFKKLQEVELSGGKSMWLDASIVEASGMPGQPIRPNKKMNLLVGFLVGLFMGLGLAYFLEYLDSSIRTIDDIRNYLKLFPLGIVPFVEKSVDENRPAEISAEVSAAQRPYWNTGDDSLPLYISEAYRMIRTNLAFGSIDNPLQVIQVTSAVKGEGKTTTVANLGISLAQAGLKTLLIDADMRRPALNHILKMMKDDEGLSTILSTGRPWQDSVASTGTSNLFFISSGPIPPNPSELLSSKRFKTFIEELKENFDKIIIDSPPVISVADSSILASSVDGTILVSRAGFIPRHLCLQAKQGLESVNGKMIGCVLNSVLAEHQPYYYQQYGYHSYYGEDSKNNPKTKFPQGENSDLEKLKALKEPLLNFLSSAWNQAMQVLKWRSPNSKSKLPDPPRG